MIRVLTVFGTRPEAIKLAPVIKALEARPREFAVGVCVTGQHREMLDQVLEFFDITPDFDLDIMSPNQTLFEITARSIAGLRETFERFSPDCVIVQGDASSSFFGALAGFYSRVAIAHVEAGLRSGDLDAPFPEEGNRKMTGQIATFHFAPTDGARDHLAREGITERVWVVGNTVIDALLEGRGLIASDGARDAGASFDFLRPESRMVLITAHRRESFGRPFREIAEGIARLSSSFPDVDFVYPVHLNPNVRGPINETLGSTPNVHLIAPVAYPEMVWLLDRCTLVLTDSGGIQEEAPALGKPVVVMRDVTERTEGVDAGTAVLVGPDTERIVSAVTRLLTDPDHYGRMARAVNPYGDGTSSARIADILADELGD